MISDSTAGATSPLALPDRLTEQPFVGWRYEAVPGRAKPAKVPIDPRTGSRASVANPRTWGDHQTAADAIGRYGLHGLGVVLTRKAGLTGVDLDDACDPISGSLDPWADAILDRLAGTYAELSPSGRGVHVFVEGTLPAGCRSRVGDVEAYCDRRFLTVTGAVLPDRPLLVTAAGGGLAWLAATHLGPRPTQGSAPTWPGFLGSDDELVRRAIAHPTAGRRLAALLAGDILDHPTRSEADYELCRILGFWCGGDPDRVERIARASDAYRLKWDELRGGRTWLRMTVEAALGRLTQAFHLSPPHSPKYCEDKSVSPAPPATPAQLDRLLDHVRALRRRLNRPVALSVRQAAQAIDVSPATAARRLKNLVQAGKLIRIRGGRWSKPTGRPGTAAEYDLPEYAKSAPTLTRGPKQSGTGRVKGSYPTIRPPYSHTPWGLIAVWRWSSRTKGWLLYGCCPTRDAAAALAGRHCRRTGLWSVGEELWRYRRGRSLAIVREPVRHREHLAELIG